MVMITRAGDVKVEGEVGERVVRTIFDIGELVGVNLSQKESDVGKVVETIAGMLDAPHMDGDRICKYFGRLCRGGGAEMLEIIAREEVPAEIQTGGDLYRALPYSNQGEILRKAATNMALAGLYCS